MAAKKEYENALAAIYNTYVAVLKVDLSNNSFQVIKENKSVKQKYTDCFTHWILSFPKSGEIFEDDLKAYLVRTDIEHLRHYFSDGHSNLSFRFRRKTEETYKWSFMELIKAQDYSAKKQMIYLYLKDIDEFSALDTKKQRELEYLCSHDALTKLRNYYAYKEACSLFLEMKRGQSVGVIFSDLNGLKIINDIQGHKTGNEYICRFSNKLREIFPYNDLFRISGDEFITVFINETEKEVFSKTKILKDWLANQSIPMASVGVAWLEHPEDIAEVTKLAESEMYQEKRRFYKLHPEYKREAVEASFSQEMNAIIMDLAKAYPTLGIVDVKNDTYRMIKIDKNHSKKFVAHSYSEYVDCFIKEYISQESKKAVDRIVRLDNLKLALLNQESTSVNFQMKNKTWRQITFRVIERINNAPTKVVFYASQINQYLSETLDKELEFRMNYELLEGLSIDYTLITWINLEDQRIHIKKQNGLPKDLIDSIQLGTYDDVRNWFAKTYVLKGDKERFLQETCLTKILEKLKNQAYYNVYARTSPMFHQTQEATFSNFYYYRVSEDSDRIVFATKNVTELIKKNIHTVDEELDLLDVVMDQETIDKLMQSVGQTKDGKKKILN